MLIFSAQQVRKNLFLLALSIMLLFSFKTIASERTLLFSGGPDGGTFQYFSAGISEYLSKELDGYKVLNEASAGSVENLRRLNKRESDFGITYSGDLYLGRNGRLSNNARQYRNVHAVAYLYGAPAHLVVLDDKRINSVSDLVGKKVAVGAVGSGAAASAKRFFESMGVWGKIEPQFLGYSEGAVSLGDGLIDALWVFAGYPNSAVIQAASANRIKLLQTYTEAQKNGKLFEDFPFYSKVVIPADTYPGVDYDVVTIQDSALWTASSRLPGDVVEKAVKLIYQSEGLDHLVSVKSTAKAMSIDSGLTGIVTPVHKGAQNFWKSKGKTLTEVQIR
ncbi:MAG: C4-dicarboxylate ABC transporter substrate-binding protein [Deltaproteobacteria bacterium]|nr:C4-dicarboxylate ABC transporter substrate-binding protein [Deltaproteobacteria bacterium]